MTLYSDRASVATKLVTQYGKAMSLQRVTGATIDPVTGAVSGGTTDTLGVTGLITRISGNDIQRVMALSGGAERLSGSEVVVKLTAAVEPQLTDRLVDGSDTYEIIHVGETNPAGTAIVYSLIARRVS